MTIEIESIQRIDLKPGEKLAIVIAGDTPITQSQLQSLKDIWEKSHPDIPAIIFGPGTQLKAINPNG